MFFVALCEKDANLGVLRKGTEGGGGGGFYDRRRIGDPGSHAVKHVFDSEHAIYSFLRQNRTARREQRY